MHLSSPAFQNGKPIPPQYSKKGGNIIPPLVFEDVPEEAVSLLLIMDDPHVPKNIIPTGVWDHWVVYNIPSEVRAVREGEAPPGEPGKNSEGGLDYLGPYPPPGWEHVYYFQLFALSEKLVFANPPTKEELLVAAEPHILARAELTGTFQA